MRFRSTKHVVWYVGGGALLIVFHVVGVLRPLERITQNITDPPVHFLFENVQRTVRAYRSWRENIDARTLLAEALREQDVLNTRIALVEAENASLRRELQYPNRSAWTAIGADVIAKVTDTGRQGIIINRGAQDGVATGQAVFAEQGVLVGQVESVQPDRAVVHLLNDHESRIGALLTKNMHPVGIVEGGYGLGINLTLIPPDEVVHIGDSVITSDTADFIPRGLVIGTIAAVGRETYEPFQHALVEPSISYDEIKTVSIIIHK